MADSKEILKVRGLKQWLESSIWPYSSSYETCLLFYFILGITLSIQNQKLQYLFHFLGIYVLFFCLCIPKVPDQKMKSSSQMTVCVRATLWDSALMNSLTTQWVACYDVCIPPKVNILQILFCYLTTGWNG